MLHFVKMCWRESKSEKDFLRSANIELMLMSDVLVADPGEIASFVDHVTIRLTVD